MRVTDWYSGIEVPKVYMNGRYRMPGYVARGADGVAEFRMRAEKADVIGNPPVAIALSISVLNYVEDKRGVKRVAIYFKRHLYTVSSAVLRNRQYVVGIGTQERFALEMSAWSIDGQAPGTGQPSLPFAPEQPPTEPHSPLRLGIPKPAEDDWHDRKDIE